jgi:glycosyltransferase involved in cell wall biosynthesis
MDAAEATVGGTVVKPATQAQRAEPRRGAASTVDTPVEADRDRFRPRVLMIAEMANPDWVSVPLEGWSHSQAISKLADVHLVTHSRNAPHISRAGVTNFTAIDTTLVEKPMYSVMKMLGMGQTTITALNTVPYYWFEYAVWRRFGARIKAREFDVVHRLTPLSPTIPSTIAAKVAAVGVPFVIGPLNGGLPWPKGFGQERRREKEWLSYVREAYRLMPGYRSTRSRAAAIIAGSRDTRQQLSEPFRAESVYIPENAIDPARFKVRVEGPVTLPLKLCFVGRFVPYKGADTLLRAAAPLIRQGKVVVDLIGDGMEMASLRAFVDREGLVGGVTFAGWVKHQELQSRLIRSDVFAFPSIREFGGAVVLEAMAVGLVPVVMDYGGPGELVSPSTGIALPMGSRDEIVAALRAALERLVSEPARVREMGERARQRALSQFTWDAKAAQVLEVYRWVMGRGPKPDFGMPLPDLARQGVLAEAVRSP